MPERPAARDPRRGMIAEEAVQISIARALAQDADRLSAITIASKRHWDYPEKWIQTWLPLLTISPEYIAGHEVWMAVKDNKAAAYYSLKQAGEDLWLDNLWVLPEFMGLGIGKQLFHHAAERCRALNFCSLKIEADPNAVGFYEKMGARKIGEHRSEVDGQPRILPMLVIDL